MFLPAAGQTYQCWRKVPQYFAWCRLPPHLPLCYVQCLWSCLTVNITKSIELRLKVDIYPRSILQNMTTIHEQLLYYHKLKWMQSL